MAHGDIVSFTQKLDHGCPPGSSFVIIAKPLKKKKRGIGVRFAASRKTALILKISIAEDGMITSRLLIDGSDTTETRTAAVLPLEKNYIFELIFTRSDVKVLFNGTRIMTFNHRTKLEKLTSLHIDGTLKLEEVIVKLYQGNGRTQILYPLTGASSEVEEKPEPEQCAYTTTPSESKTLVTSPEPAEPLSPPCKPNGDSEPAAPETCPIAILTPMGLLIPPNLPPAILIQQTGLAENEQLHSAPLPLGCIQPAQETVYWGADNQITTDELAAYLNNLSKSICQARNSNVSDVSRKEHYLSPFLRSTRTGNPRIATALKSIDKEVQNIYNETPALMKMLESIAASGQAKAYAHEVAKHDMGMEMSSSAVPTYHNGNVKSALSSSLDQLKNRDAASTMLLQEHVYENMRPKIANTMSKKGTPSGSSGEGTTSSSTDMESRTEKGPVYCNISAFDKCGTTGKKRDISQKNSPTSLVVKGKQQEHHVDSLYTPIRKSATKVHKGSTQVTATKVEQHHLRIEHDSHNNENVEEQNKSVTDGGHNMDRTTYSKSPSSADENDYEKYWCFNKAQKLAGTLESKLTVFEKVCGGKYAQPNKVGQKKPGLVTATVRRSCEDPVSSKWKVKLDAGSKRDPKAKDPHELLKQRL
ncbi:unnamed protein product [Cylicocyclus nassatus]|uniref:Galectin domain-containing protein n=1 Tax=Cylicocyclus nassatus TaxID=53992 RepID=A0AA36GQZ2_CYLNA|nr:unnamed protein product [Cylicocyclus nassatus]